MRVILNKAERLWKIPQLALGSMHFTEKRLESRNVEPIDLESFAPQLPQRYHSSEILMPISEPPKFANLLIALTEKILSRHNSLSNIELDPQKEIIITPGIRTTAAWLTLGLLNPGESAAYPDPGLQYFRSAISLADGISRRYSLQESNDYLLNISSLNSAAFRKTKLLFLNYPHNPTGAAVDYYFYRELLSALRFANILTIADCAYVHPGDPDLSGPLQVKNARRMVVELHSFATSFGIPGLGFAVGHKDAISILRPIQTSQSFSPSPSDLMTALNLLDKADEIFLSNMETMRSNRELLSEGLKKLDWQVKGGRLAPFIWAKPPVRSTSVAFARRLFTKAGVRVSPGSDFGENGEGWIRMALGRDESELREALMRLSDHSKIWQRKFRP